MEIKILPNATSKLQELQYFDEENVSQQTMTNEQLRYYRNAPAFE